MFQAALLLLTPVVSHSSTAVVAWVNKQRRQSCTFGNSIQHSLITFISGSNNYLNCTNNLERISLILHLQYFHLNSN